LKLVQEGVASVDQVDRICRLAGGFRMGPFELIDLIGVDVNFEIARSFYEQSFGEPRWRPNPIQARLVSAGHHGRKSGRGFYDYSSAAHRAADPEAPEPAGGDGRLIVVAGDGLVADLLRERARCAGFVLHDPGDVGNEEPWLTVDTTLHGDGVAEAEGPLVVSCAASSLKRRRAAGAAGFHVLPVAGTRLVELAAGAHTDPQATARASAFFAALGLAVEHVGDAPGLVMGRIAAQLVNEAHFAVAEGVGTAQDVDAGTTLGLNYPHGSCALGALLGAEYVRAVLDGLYDERHEERYRLAPTLCG
jgi:3-hydroxybutyryl-CoA dehydrogenase